MAVFILIAILIAWQQHQIQKVSALLIKTTEKVLEHEKKLVYVETYEENKNI